MTKEIQLTQGQVEIVDDLRYGAGMTSARKLQLETKYEKWDNFNNLIARAKNLITHGLYAGEIIDTECSINIGSGAVRCVKDYLLDKHSERLIKKMALSYKLGKVFLMRNETAVLGLLQKYCKHKGYYSEFQFHLGCYIFDFRCENLLIEFDEPSHIGKRQKNVDALKNKTAQENGYLIFRFGLTHDIVDIIFCVESNIIPAQTIECDCGYIATFRGKFTCPDCGTELDKR
jgi:very-short-patch-repair endonuclease